MGFLAFDYWPLRLTIDPIFATRCCFRPGFTGIVQTEQMVERPQAGRFQAKSNNADFVSKSALLGGGAYRIRTGDLYNANVAR